jgi:hypothetical protein
MSTTFLECKFITCPKCGHDWIGHFGMIDPNTKELVVPYPAECMEGCGCMKAFDEVTL